MQSPNVKYTTPIPPITPRSESRRAAGPNRDDDDEVGDVSDDVCVMFQLEKRMIKLHLCTNHRCESCIDDLTYIALRSEDDKLRTLVSAKLTSSGLLELFQHLWNRYFSKDFLGMNTDGEEVDESIFVVLSLVDSTVVNVTDSSQEACNRVLALNLHVVIMEYLMSDYLNPSTEGRQRNDRWNRIVDSLLTIIYNVVQSTTEAREMLREHDVVSVLKRYRTTDRNSLSTLALITQAWVVNEEESEQINSDKNAFLFLVRELRSSLRNGLLYGCIVLVYISDSLVFF